MPSPTIRRLGDRMGHSKNRTGWGARGGRARIITELRARDGDNCMWCGRPIDFALVEPDPMACTIDHIKAFADGGTHARDNLQLMHHDCNQEEGKWEALARKWKGLG